MASLRFILISLLVGLGTTAGAAFIEISEQQARDAINRLDEAIARRGQYISARHRHIDSLKLAYATSPDDLATIKALGDAYISFDNDSALVYLQYGIDKAGSDTEALPFRLKQAEIMPLSGLIDNAIASYNAILPDSVPDSLRQLYYDSGRQMYSYISSFYDRHPVLKERYGRLALDRQEKLIGLLDKNSDIYRFNIGEHYFLTGNDAKAKAYLSEIADSPNADQRLRARAHHHLSAMAKKRDDENARIYHLAESALSDTETATLEVISLQELGAMLFDFGDIDRAYTYLSTALDNAVSCGAELRIIESSRSLPLIEKTHSEKTSSDSHILRIVLFILAVLVIGLIVTLCILRKEMMSMNHLQANLRVANKNKEVYISQFLSLCSIYMDKLNQFCKLANRKISAGKVDDLYRLTKSGKFIEEQSSEFYDIFDNAFLHLYPGFVGEVNKLLKPDCQIELKEGEMLNTDLRILAFMRLGIEDSSRIAQVLNYSLNTIYAYRNRMKARAVDRETFEKDIMNIGDD